MHPFRGPTGVGREFSRGRRRNTGFNSFQILSFSECRHPACSLSEESVKHVKLGVHHAIFLKVSFAFREDKTVSKTLQTPSKPVL